MAEEHITIYELKRLIKDLNGLSKADFLEKLEVHITIKNHEEHTFKPFQKHQFGMYLDQQFYSLVLKKEQTDFDNALDALDAHILYEKVLLPILNIVDLRNDERIEYVSGKQPIQDLKQKIDDQEFEVGFLLFPSNINEIKSLADHDLIMPPKSTYIEPKFISGLVIYEL